jgi:hypothetical protein
VPEKNTRKYILDILEEFKVRERHRNRIQVCSSMYVECGSLDTSPPTSASATLCMLLQKISIHLMEEVFLSIGFVERPPEEEDTLSTGCVLSEFNTDKGRKPSVYWLCRRQCVC